MLNSSHVDLHISLLHITDSLCTVVVSSVFSDVITQYFTVILFIL